MQGKFREYEINFVIISKVENYLEPNLQFIRLQLGLALNGEEKLRAMTGEMRDAIFTDLRENKLFDHFEIRHFNRYVREQIAAQIFLNYFSKKLSEEYHRSRYIDLQDFFKLNSSLDTKDKQMVDQIRSTLSTVDSISKIVTTSSPIRPPLCQLSFLLVNS